MIVWWECRIFAVQLNEVLIPSDVVHDFPFVLHHASLVADIVCNHRGIFFFSIIIQLLQVVMLP